MNHGEMKESCEHSINEKNKGLGKKSVRKLQTEVIGQVQGKHIFV